MHPVILLFNPNATNKIIETTKTNWQDLAINVARFDKSQHRYCRFSAQKYKDFNDWIFFANLATFNF